MNNAVKSMLEKYHCATAQEYKSALKEIIQEIALLGLSRAKFFEHAAFYGGTALRIVYGLGRFSEDLDFSLIKPDADFSVSSYCKCIADELAAFGFKVNVERMEKAKHTAIESAFIKGNTLIQLLQIEGLDNPESGTHRNELLKIKLEIDTDPPPGADYDVQYLLNPIPFSVKCYDVSSMFAGKMHAFLCRNPQSIRVKGRDIFDVIWFISQNNKLNLDHLIQRMRQTRNLSENEQISSMELREMFRDKVNSLDMALAKQDVLPFIKDTYTVELWSKEFLSGLADKIILNEN